MWPMICLHVSIWCNLSASLYLHRKVKPHCKTTINQKNKPKNPTGPPLCSGHAGGPLGNVLLHLMNAFDGVYLWQQSTCTWNRKWVMENKADVGAVRLYDSTHRSRQGVTYSAVHWRHSSALTAVIGNGVVACGAQRVCMCDGVCVYVCVNVQSALLWRQWVREADRKPERGPWLSLHLPCPDMQPRRAFSCVCCMLLCVRLRVWVHRSRICRAWSFKCMRSQHSSPGPILSPATHGVPRLPQTYWANDQPWQLKPICESVWHQEGHLLPAL